MSLERWCLNHSVLKCSMYLSHYMQATFFYLQKLWKKLADDQCSSITKGSIYHIRHMFTQPFTTHGSGLTWKLMFKYLYTGCPNEMLTLWKVILTAVQNKSHMIFHWLSRTGISFKMKLIWLKPVTPIKSYDT